MAGNDDYQLTGFLLSPALHCTAPLYLHWVEEVLVRCGGGGCWWVLVGGPRRLSEFLSVGLKM